MYTQTKERAAEIAGVSLYEIVDAARHQGIPPRLSVNETLEEIKRLVPSGQMTTQKSKARRS